MTGKLLLEADLGVRIQGFGALEMGQRGTVGNLSREKKKKRTNIIVPRVNGGFEGKVIRPRSG